MMAFPATLSYDSATAVPVVSRTLDAEIRYARPKYSFGQSTTSEYIPTPWDSRFLVHRIKLESLESQPDLCDDQTEPPSKDSIGLAKTVLQSFQLDSVVPSRILSSTEGGVTICFVNGNKYADIECLNSGEILGVITNRRDRPCVWEIRPHPDDIARASARIGEFIGVSTP